MANIQDIVGALAVLNSFNNNASAPPLTPFDNGNGGQQPPMAPVGQPPISVMPPAAPPEAPPTAPTPALDPSIIQRYLAFAPPAPTPPPQPSGLQRFANALAGFGAGVQGNGAQFLAQLQQPQREYQQQLAQNNAARTELGIRGLEAAQREQSQTQAETQAQANRQQQQDFEVAMRKAGVTDQQAMEQMRQAFQLNFQREQERIADEKLKEQQQLKLDEDLGKQIKFYRSNGVDNAAQARRLALNDLADSVRRLGREVPTLSADDNKQLALVNAKITKAAADANLANVKANKVTVNLGGEGKAGPVYAQLEDGSVIPAAQVDRRSGTASINGQTLNVTGYVGGHLPTQPQGQQPAQPSKPPFSELGMFNPFTGQQPQAQPGKTVTMDAVRQSAKQAGISATKALQQFKDAGYTIQK